MLANLVISSAIILGGLSPQEPRPPKIDIKPPVEAKCPQFWKTALKVGWHRKNLKKLDQIMYRESRCLTQAFNPDDPAGGSRGLMQINGFWTPWLHKQGVTSSPKADEELLQPETNLLSALLIYNYGVKQYGNGWGPWRA